ncbi:MAG: ferredoxin--nitrite reductase [Synechococcaceae cyanobacterium RL_1_2]|nr:ferredoxin--nitrite reductase [Synechococcaceae cyanobacterium RL_1_2]
MKVGDRVRVNTSVVVYHNPEKRKEPFDLQGSEGEIVKVIEEPITANLPIVVAFNPKFKAHLRENELELIN